MRYTPGRSSAFVRTCVRIAVSSLSLAMGTEDRRPPVDRMRADQSRAAPRARSPGPPICLERGGKRPALASGVTVVPKARPARRDGRGQHTDNLVAQPRGVRGRELPRLARGIDPRAPERLVRVDVADAGDEPLVHERLLDRLPRARKKLR